MHPLASWDELARTRITGVLTDIDDTLTTDGAITADALQALADLKASGLHVIPITGRPVGWSEPFAAAWPVDSIVAENGAVALMHAAGMNATVSSIHINGWFGAHNKLEGARWIVRELFGRDLDAELERWVYIGDSTNDQLMFAHFPHSVGVANIARFVPQLQHLPRYVTQGERGAGFAELAQSLLAINDR